MLAQRSDGLLTPIATAEFYTAANSPKVTHDQIQQWLDKGQPPARGRAARPPRAHTRGATVTPGMPAGADVLPARHRRPSACARARSTTGRCPPTCARRSSTASPTTIPTAPAPCSTGSTPCSAPRRVPNGASAWRGATTSRTATRRRWRSPRRLPERQWAMGCRGRLGRGPRRMAHGRLRDRGHVLRAFRRRHGAIAELRSAGYYWASRRCAALPPPRTQRQPAALGSGQR